MQKGQLLARLDRIAARRACWRRTTPRSARADAAIDQAKSLIAQSASQVELAASDYDRAKKLGAGVMAVSTVEQREINAEDRRRRRWRRAQERARASRRPTARARDADRQELMVRIGRTEVRAPVAGLDQPPLGQARRHRRAGRRAAVPHHRRRRHRPRRRRAGAMAAAAEGRHAGDAEAARRRGAGRRRRSGWSTRRSTRRAAPARRASRSTDVSHARLGAFASGEVDLAAPRRRRRADDSALRARRRRRRRARRQGRQGRGAQGEARHRRRRRGRNSQRRRAGRNAGRARRLVPAARATRCGRCRQSSAPAAEGTVMRLNVSAWSIRKPIPAIVALLRADAARPGQLPLDVDHPLPEHRHSDRAGADHPVGRRAVGAGSAGHQEGRGRGRQPQRRLAHRQPDQRRLVADDHPVLCRLDRHRPRAQRREGPDRQDPQPICRAPSTSRSSTASTSRACRSSPTRPRRRA